MLKTQLCPWPQKNKRRATNVLDCFGSRANNQLVVAFGWKANIPPLVANAVNSTLAKAAAEYDSCSWTGGSKPRLKRGQQMQDDISPDHILQIGFGFWASKTLLSAVELAVFSQLAEGQKSGPELQASLGLHPRATYDFLDTLVALGLLQRDGAGESGKYANTPATARFLVKTSPQYVGGILEMANARLYRFWADLTPALKTGQPQNEIKETGKSMFESLYADSARLEQFMDAMSGISMGNFMAFAEKFDFANYETLADIGGATGQLATRLGGLGLIVRRSICGLI